MRASGRIAGALAGLVLAACTKIIGLPDLPDVKGAGGTGLGGSSNGGASGSSAVASGGTHPSARGGTGGAGATSAGGSGGDETPTTGGSSAGGTAGNIGAAGEAGAESAGSGGSGGTLEVAGGSAGSGTVGSSGGTGGSGGSSGGTGGSTGGNGASTGGTGGTGGTGVTYCPDAPNMPTSCQISQIGVAAQWAKWSVSGPHTFKVVSDDLVSDDATGLTWQRNVAERNDASCSGPVTLNRDEATCYCNSLSLPDATFGWRLPSRVELITLLSYGSEPIIDTNAFPDTPSDYFWTSSTESDGGGGWYVSLGSGAVNLRRDDTNAYYFVRCVRGGSRSAPAAYHYTVGSGTLAGTVLDNGTQLRWQTAFFGPESTADLAADCAASTVGGRSWRSPNLSELLSLVDETLSAPAYDGGLFQSGPDTIFGPDYDYGSSTVAPNGINAVSFAVGETEGMDPKTSKLSRCVTDE
jgi:hypothetical protein